MKILNRGFAPIAVVLIVVAVLAVGGVYYFNQDSKNKLSTPEEADENNNNPVDQSQSTVSQPQSSNNQPGQVASVTAQGGGQWLISVDLLSHNPSWLPGVDSSGGFFINPDPAVYNLAVSSSTRTYSCGPGPDGNDTSADVLINTSTYMQELQADSYKNRYFDLNGTNVVAIYSQCLP